MRVISTMTISHQQPGYTFHTIYQIYVPVKPCTSLCESQQPLLFFISCFFEQPFFNQESHLRFSSHPSKKHPRKLSTAKMNPASRTITLHFYRALKISCKMEWSKLTFKETKTNSFHIMYMYVHDEDVHKTICR